MGDMARHQRDAQLEPFPRDLLDEVVRALMNVAEQAPVTEAGFAFEGEILDSLRLVEGRHLAAGARYRIAAEEVTADLSVAAWNKVGETRIDVTTGSEGHTADLHVDVRMSGQRFHSIRITGDYQGPKPFRMLRRAKWECEVRAEDWWRLLGPKTSPLSLRVEHPLAVVDLQVARGKDENGRWSVDTTARFGGRSIARPLAAVALAVMRRRIRRMLNEWISTAVSRWNADVPVMVEHGLRERLDFEHRVTLKAVSREWAEAYTTALHQAIEGAPLEKGGLIRSSEGAVSVRLLEGEHIGPGARYHIAPIPEDSAEPLDVTVVAWELDGPNRVEFSSPDDAQTGWVEIDSARKPTVARAALAGALEGFTQASCEAEMDLERWWASEDPALTATADSPLGEAGLTIRRTPAGTGEWTVNIAATAEGRAWARQLVAVAGLLAAVPMNRSFKERADAAASHWHDLVGGEEEISPKDAADATLRALLDHGSPDWTGTRRALRRMEAELSRHLGELEALTA
ncbi:hypothetical protein [Actinomadura bangladeshensis]|uniref:Uncharacterized protein n=1 Tax=Actinomadura bangladeshensis TaxID=453573 RepID=A0A6L9QGK9_9ACTN|nr:hypothetical protein [Actinomadura bangladeshensis]NEA24599.1 hypothetical protein [Actinomadura bangladeshensis]